MSPPSTPLAIDEISAACGAESALGPAPGMPTKPSVFLSRSSTNGIASDPNTTPRISANCCFHGVAPTSWPVLRSWRLSFEMVAIEKMIAVVNSA